MVGAETDVPEAGEHHDDDEDDAEGGEGDVVPAEAGRDRGDGVADHGLGLTPGEHRPRRDGEDADEGSAEDDGVDAAGRRRRGGTGTGRLGVGSGRPHPRSTCPPGTVPVARATPAAEGGSVMASQAVFRGSPSGVERHAGAVAVERRVRGRQGRVAEDEVGGLLGDHHHGGVRVAVGHVGEHGGVDDAESLDAVDAHGERVDDAHLVGAHLRGAGGVEGGLAVAGDPVEDLLVGLDLGPGGELARGGNAANAGWAKIVRAARTISTHSRRSFSVER